MKDFSASSTLLTALPVILVLLALVGAIVFFPKGGTFDPRSSASLTRPTPTAISLPIAVIAPEVACSELYSPVCSQVDRQTYANECEAGLAKALPATPGECPKQSSSKY